MDTIARKWYNLGGTITSFSDSLNHQNCVCEHPQCSIRRRANYLISVVDSFILLLNQIGAPGSLTQEPGRRTSHRPMYKYLAKSLEAKEHHSKNTQDPREEERTPASVPVSSPGSATLEGTPLQTHSRRIPPKI